MSLTIKNVAKIAGVCRATVDKVIHNRPGVREETRQRIKQIITDLGYRSNIAGKALRLQQNKPTIMIILLKLDALPHILNGIKEQLESVKDFGLIGEIQVVSYPDTETQTRILKECSTKNIKGVIIHPLNDKHVTEAINHLVEKKIPVITVNSDLPDSARSCFVGQNMTQAGRTAAHLMAKFLSGSGTVAAVTGSQELLGNLYRLKGFSEHLQKYPGIELIKTVETREDPLLTYQKTAELLHNAPNLKGIFITSGGVREVGRAVSALGFADKITIICYDLYDDIRELVHQGIIDCTIGQDLHKQGSYPIQLFFQHLYYNQPLPKGEIFTPIDIRVVENIDYPLNC
jgi:LacI family transcriptional regulator